MRAVEGGTSRHFSRGKGRTRRCFVEGVIIDKSSAHRENPASSCRIMNQDMSSVHSVVSIQFRMCRMFDHEYFDVYPFEDIPLNRDCYLMDECYLQEYEASMLDVFADKGGAPIGYISYSAARKINGHSLDLSWYPNISSRFHEVAISLPRNQFVTCVGSWRYSEKPHIFVKSGWLEELHRRSYTVFCMVDAIGVKAALQNGILSRERPTS